MRKDGWKKVAMLSAMAGAVILTTGCARTMAGGDAGCTSYGEARLSMPDKPVPPGAWGGWVANTDDRMTGTCR